jgi:hypothetical protein
MPGKGFIVVSNESKRSAPRQCFGGNLMTSGMFKAAKEIRKMCAKRIV